MTDEILSPRECILKTALDYTCGDRNASYGDPTVQLGLAGHLKGLVWEYYAQNGSRLIVPAEREAIDMILTKLSRLIVGPEPGQDTYIDLAAYAAIAGEAAK